MLLYYSILDAVNAITNEIHSVVFEKQVLKTKGCHFKVLLLCNC